MTNSALTDRIYINETFSLDEFSSSSTEVVIARLTELLAEGYTTVYIRAHEDECGSPDFSFEVIRQRLENDEEYGRRVGMVETYRQRRYQEYLRMREEFGDTGPFEPN